MINKIIVKQIIENSEDKYPREETIYEQIVNNADIPRIVSVVNNLKDIEE